MLVQNKFHHSLQEVAVSRLITTPYIIYLLIHIARRVLFGCFDPPLHPLLIGHDETHNQLVRRDDIYFSTWIQIVPVCRHSPGLMISGAHVNIVVFNIKAKILARLMHARH